MKLYVNTAPKAVTRKDGTMFWTVLVGVAKAILLAKGVTEAQLESLKMEMQIFPEKVELYTKAFNKSQKTGKKLIVNCDDVVVTEVKPNNYVTKTGVVVNGWQASCWAVNGTLDVLNPSMGIGDELKRLLDEDGDDGEDLIG